MPLPSTTPPVEWCRKMIVASAGYGCAPPPLELLDELDELDELELLDELEELDELELAPPVAAVTADSLPPPPPHDPRHTAHNNVSIVINLHILVSPLAGQRDD